MGNASSVTECANSVFDAAGEFHHECFAEESPGANPSVHEDSEYIVLQE